jgi:hypothetical protein
LAVQAVEILKKNCYRCHGGKDKEGKLVLKKGVNILDFKALMKPGKKQKLWAGQPKKSKIYLRMVDEDDPMPPEDEKPRPSKEEIAVIEKWIKAGTHDPSGKPAPRPKPVTGKIDIATLLEARNILRTNCYACHGPAKTGGMDYILNATVLKEKKKVIAGDARKSRIIRMIRSGSMPPETEKQKPSRADVAVLEKWIAAGAPDFPNEQREVQEHPGHAEDHRPLPAQAGRRGSPLHPLLHADAPVQPPAGERDGHTPLPRRPLQDPQQPQLEVAHRPASGARSGADRVCHRHSRPGLGPRRPLERLTRAYPYTRRPGDWAENDLRRLDCEVRGLSRCEVPSVRADWFVAMAARPPLYHTLLRLPKQARTLERKLGVDVLRNFRNDRLVRSGFTRSGVSVHNRLVERHDSRYGAYWRTYNFRSSAGRGRLHSYPLGPVFKGSSTNRRSSTTALRSSSTRPESALPPRCSGDRREEREVTDRFFRTLRGGSFQDSAPSVRSACRLSYRPSDRYDVVGLRVARTHR